MVASDKKQDIVTNLGKNQQDTGSTAVQVGILTEQIRQRTDHLKDNSHDYMARRGLLQAVGKRKKLLRYMADNNSKEYLALVKKLGIRK